MSFAQKRAAASLSIRRVARQEAERQARELFGELKTALESRIPCRCTLLGSDLSEKLEIELSIELRFENYREMVDAEGNAGDFLEENCQALIGWKRSSSNDYGFKAILLF